MSFPSTASTSANFSAAGMWSDICCSYRFCFIYKYVIFFDRVSEENEKYIFFVERTVKLLAVAKVGHSSLQNAPSKRNSRKLDEE